MFFTKYLILLLLCSSSFSFLFLYESFDDVYLLHSHTQKSSILTDSNILIPFITFIDDFYVVTIHLVGYRLSFPEFTAFNSYCLFDCKLHTNVILKFVFYNFNWGLVFVTICLFLCLDSVCFSEQLLNHLFDLLLLSGNVLPNPGPLESWDGQSVIEASDEVGHSINYAGFKEFHSSINNLGLDDTNFSIVHFNARSLRKNFCNIFDFLEALNFKFTIIGITETWLRNDCLDAYSLPGYRYENFERKFKIGGGLGLYIAEGITYKVRKDLSISDNNIELLFIEINEGRRKNRLIGLTYKAPQVDISNYVEALDLRLGKVIREDKLVSLMGDFNINLLKYDNDMQVREFLDSMYSFSFHSLIDQPTRITQSTSTLIDNIFVNFEYSQFLSGSLVSDISDHLPVFCIHTDKVPQTYSPILKRNVSPKNIGKLREALLELDWHEVYINDDPNVAYNIFLSMFKNLYNRYCPEFFCKYSGKRKNVWMTNEIIVLRNVKNKLYKKYLKNSTNTNFELYRVKRNELNHTIRRIKKEFFHRNLERCSDNMKKMWKVLNGLLGKSSKARQPCLIEIDGLEITDPVEISNRFNSYFVNIGSELAKKIPKTDVTFDSYLRKPNQRTIFFYPVTYNELLNIILSLKKSNSCGFDDISTFVVQSTVFEIIDPLLHVVNQSLIMGLVPDKLKIAKVIPIYKNGGSMFMSNYRPISILPVLSKVLERVVFNRVYNFFDQNFLLSQSQFGFRKGYSTYMAIFNILDRLYQSFDDRNSTIGIFLDLSKAFDTVNHDILLNKLEYYGVRGIALEWMKSYLKDRYQFVLFDSSPSSSSLITCGVPQGSILGPLLFIIYINDILGATDKVELTCFADDTSFFCTGNDLGQIAETVNEALTELSQWFRSNCLSLNAQKTKYMLFSKKMNTCAFIPPCIDDVPISGVHSIKFLGLYLNDKLNWNDHINHILAVTARQIGILNRIKYDIPVKSLVLLYNTLILPFFNYCLLIWGSTSLGNLNKILKLQKRTLRIITLSPYDSHTLPIFLKYGILKIQDLFSLQLSMFMYRYVYGLLPSIFSNYFIKNNLIHDHYTRNCNDINIFLAKTTLGQRSVKYVGAKVWNSLPEDVRTSSSLIIFKRKIKESLLFYYAPSHQVSHH